MANLNTTQIVHDLLGPSQRVYYQYLGTSSDEENPKADYLGARDFVYVDTNPPGQNPGHYFNILQRGVLTYVERPVTPDEHNTGHHAAVDAHNITMPERFALTATFIKPYKGSLISNQPPPEGTYAATLLLDFGTLLTGATSQFRTSGQRLNTPKIAIPPQRDNIAADLSSRVIDQQNPSPFTLVLYVERGSTDSAGVAKLFVGADQADSFPFTFGNGLTSATLFNYIRAGIGTAGATPTVPATNYFSSVYLTEFEIWTPISGIQIMMAVHSGLFADIKGASTSPGTELIQWTLNENPNQQWEFEPLTGPDTGYHQIRSVNSGLLLHAAATIGGEAKVIQYSPVDGDYQKWKLIPSDEAGEASYYIVSKSSEMAMDVRGASLDKGARVIQWNLSGFANQRWILRPLSV